MSRAKYLSISLVIFFGIGLAGCQYGPEGREETRSNLAAATPRPIAVEVFTVKPLAAAGEQLIPAVVSVEATAMVLAKRDGIVVWLAGQEGTPVAKDQVIVRLEGDESRAQLRQAELEVNRMKVEERQYEALVKVNQTELERERALFKDGLVSQRELDQAEYKFDGARQELEKTRLATHIAQVRVEAAKWEIEKANIRAPISGIITRSYIKLAASVVKNDKLFEVAQLAPLEVRFQIPQTEKRQLVLGSLLNLSLAESDRIIARARVQRIDPVVDATSNSLSYLAKVVGGDGLVPGVAVYVRIPRDREASTLWIPRAAFPAEATLSRGVSGTLFVLNSETCGARAVLIDVVEGDQVGISSGLAINDQVILAPPAELKAGDVVEVMNK